MTSVNSTDNSIDLIGSSFSVLESSPDVFTALTRKLGINGLEFIELYDIEPWAVDHLSPLGLIFCFLWCKDTHKPSDFEDPAASQVWFANQLSDDACATQAILNVLLNCPDVDIGDSLREFYSDTHLMSPVIKGLSVSSHPLIRRAHNSFARPADLRGSEHAIAETTLKEEEKRKKAAAEARKLVARKKSKTTLKKRTTLKQSSEEDNEETYHFIGYVPRGGKVWEMDGLKSGPLEVGELDSTSPTEGWMDVVRPALRMKMKKYGGASEGGNIRFSLLAIVKGGYEKASDAFEYLRRDKASLERKMEEGWEQMVNSELLNISKGVFNSSDAASTYAPDFSHRRLHRDAEILGLDPSQLVSAWEECITNAALAKALLDEEIAKGIKAHTEHIKRVHDYEPFFQKYLEELHHNGFLNPLLDRDEQGKKISAKKRKADL